ncbi:hypothetical protein [Paenibacillus sp. Soil750]|nr:hypothetical protein [Paenibacillus sp. Soil750]
MCVGWQTGGNNLGGSRISAVAAVAVALAISVAALVLVLAATVV